MNPSEEERAENDESWTAGEAFVMCQTFVERLLKAPKTADFPAGEAERLGPNRWRSVSYVDAENSFGAMLRTHYYCEIEEASPDNWRAIDVRLIE